MRRSAAAWFKKKARKTKKRPWAVIADEWGEDIRHVFGKHAEVTPWGPAEKKLARMLVKEESMVAMVDGKGAESVAERRRRDREYDSANDGQDGWGDVFEKGEDPVVVDPVVTPLMTKSIEPKETVPERRRRDREYDQKNDGADGWDGIFGDS